MADFPLERLQGPRQHPRHTNLCCLLGNINLASFHLSRHRSDRYSKLWGFHWSECQLALSINLLWSCMYSINRKSLLDLHPLVGCVDSPLVQQSNSLGLVFDLSVTFWMGVTYNALRLKS